MPLGEYERITMSSPPKRGCSTRIRFLEAEVAVLPADAGVIRLPGARPVPCPGPPRRRGGNPQSSITRRGPPAQAGRPRPPG
jgi:hypothetical protein